MTTGDVTRIVAALPEAQAIGDETYWNRVVPLIVPHVADEVINAFDWAFTMNEYSSVETVADQSDYTLSGSNFDLRDIVSIRYGSDKKPLMRLRSLDADDMVYDTSITAVQYWHEFDTTNDGYPVITLIATPTVAGTALYVRYRLKDVPLKKFPDGFGYVLVRGVMAFLRPDRTYAYEKALKGMIERYRAGGKDIQIAPLDPHLVLGNNQIADVYGSG